MSGLGNKEIMSRNLTKYMNLSGKTRNEICSELGFKYSTFTEWANGNIYPRIDKIEMLANYFGIKKSDLIEENKDAEGGTYLNGEARKMLEAYNERSDLKILFNELTDWDTEDVQYIIGLVERMKKNK